MTKEQIDQAFEGRWRIKAENKPVASVKGVKDLCREFFTAGIMLAERNTTPVYANTMKMEMPTTPEEAEKPVMIIDVERLVSANGGFDKWWDVYDKKRGREKCLKKWEKLTDTEKYLCLLRTPEYVASTPDKQYRKDPLTYLNQKAWNDEIIFRNGTDKQQQQRERLTEVANRIAEYTKDAK